MKDIVITFGVIMFLVVVIGSVSVLPDRQNGFGGEKGEYHQYAAFFPNAQGRMDVVRRVVSAGGLPVREGVHQSIIISASMDNDYSKKLYDRGALFVFNPIIKGSCVTEDRSSFNVTNI